MGTGRFQTKKPNKSNKPRSKKEVHFDEAALWDRAKKNAEEVATWPKWKQKIIISAHSAMTGQFIMSEKEWKERYGKSSKMKKEH